MKILMAAMGLGIGGAETHIMELTYELLRRGHQVIIASNGGIYEQELCAAGAKHYAVPMNSRSVTAMAKSLRLLKNIIKTEKPDVVHAHARIPAFLCGILKRRLKFAFVTTAHGVYDVNALLRRLTNWGERTISVSRDVTEYLESKYGVPEGNIIPTKNGIDTEKFSPDRDDAEIRGELSIPEGAPVLLHVSRLDEQSSVVAETLLNVAQTLAGRVPDVRIVIAGGGTRFDELRSIAGEVNLKLGYRAISMIGPRSDIDKVVPVADAFVGVSRAALEAMSAGIPTVVAGNQGYMGIFDEESIERGIECNFCGRGCDGVESGRLLDDVTTLLTLSPDERDRLAEVSRNVVIENYSISSMADDAERAYREAAGAVRLLISGYYGYGNAGDEAVLSGILSTVRSIVPSADIAVLSGDPESTAREYGCRAVKRFSPFLILRELRRCDALISGGGSLIQDVTSTRSLIYYLAIIRLAKLLGKPVMVYANGIGPVGRSGNRRLVRRALERADVVTLRDKNSLEELLSMGVERKDMTVTADPAFALPVPDITGVRAILEENGVPDRAYFVISVRPWDVEPVFYENFARICDEITRQHDISPVLLQMQPSCDGSMGEKVAALMEEPAYIIRGDHSVRELMSIIGGASLVLSMRLHALIFAACAATPAIGFVYDPKVSSYLELLGQPSAGSTGELRVSDALAAADIIFHRKEEFELRLEDIREGLVAAERGNAEALAEFLRSNGLI